MGFLCECKANVDREIIIVPSLIKNQLRAGVLEAAAGRLIMKVYENGFASEI